MLARLRCSKAVQLYEENDLPKKQTATAQILRSKGQFGLHLCSDYTRSLQIDQALVDHTEHA